MSIIARGETSLKQEPSAPPGIIIAAPHSGSGKTTLTNGLILALKEQGMTVQCFKVGPDYLDPTYHKLLSGRWSYNLDGWMGSADDIRMRYAEAGKDADVCVIEGVMGLFDGYGATSEEGSTAQVAKILQVPVLLVIDAKGMSRSVAAVVKGFAGFDPDVHIAGVVFNNAGSAYHLSLLKEAVEKETDIPVIGGLVRNAELHLEQRHLGLKSASEEVIGDPYLKDLSEHIRNGVDMNTFLKIFHLEGIKRKTPLHRAAGDEEAEGEKPVIAVAFDDAFHFYYKANFEALEKAGARLKFFSPLYDSALPSDATALYIGGGYPELFAPRLSQNALMKESVRHFVQKGFPVYAECGGLIYLSKTLSTLQEQQFKMCSLFPFSCRMLPRRKILGYVSVTLQQDTFLGKAGSSFRGHEFHYSEIEDTEENKVETCFQIAKRRGGEARSEGYKIQNVLASYVHAYFPSNPDMAALFTEAAGEARKREIVSE